MTKYQKLKALAQSKGIDTRKPSYSGGGYWLCKPDGSDLFAYDNFCANLRELEYEIMNFDRPIRFQMSHGPDGDVRLTRTN
jgi:hypothetical protein